MMETQDMWKLVALLVLTLACSAFAMKEVLSARRETGTGRASALLREASSKAGSKKGESKLAGKLMKGLKQRFQKKALEEQLYHAEMQIAENSRGGLGVQRAVLACIQQSRDPLRQQLLILYNEISYSGVSLAKAFDNMAQRTGSEDARLLASVIGAQQETGSNLADTLDFLSESIGKRLQMRSTLRARIAETKLTSVITALSPLLVAGIGKAFITGFDDFYLHTTAGHIILAACVFLELAGIAVLAKMSHRKVI